MHVTGSIPVLVTKNTIMTSEQIFKIEFDKLKADIGNEYERLGMRATGDFKEGLEVQVAPETGKLLGLPYALQLDEGRKPTSSGGDGKLLKKIKKWIVDKGIVNNIKGDISVSSLAFLITRKIHREGWKREGHGGVNLISNVVTDKRMQDIINKIGNAMTLSFVSKLEKEFKTVGI